METIEPDGRRAVVRHVQDRCGVSEGVARSTQRYQGRGDNEGRASMRARLISTIVDDLEALVGMTRLCLASVLANSSPRLRSNASSRFRRGLLHPPSGQNLVRITVLELRDTT